MVTVKELLSSNSGFGDRVEESISARKKVTGGSDEGAWDFSSKKNWKEAAKMEEVAEAALNYLSIVFMVRSWDYSGVSLVRVLHTVRYFKGAAGSDLVRQRKLCELFMNQVFR